MVPPLISPMFALRALEARRAAAETQARNSGQIATVGNWYRTTGSGYLAPSDIMTFSTTFTDEPTVTTGAIVETPGTAGSGPTTAAGVLSWVRDAAGYYVGAKIWVSVTGGTATTVIRHTFSFTGVAVKIPGLALTEVTGPISPKVPRIGL